MKEETGAARVKESGRFLKKAAQKLLFYAGLRR
jgi:hypothetical protein